MALAHAHLRASAGAAAPITEAAPRPEEVDSRSGSGDLGVSFGGASGSRAFIWQAGVLTNLNDLVDIAPDILVSAQDINDAGQITGRVRDGVTGEVRAFVATPIAN